VLIHNVILYLRSFGMLRSVEWRFSTKISGKLIVPISKQSKIMMGTFMYAFYTGKGAGSDWISDNMMPANRLTEHEQVGGRKEF